MAKLSETENERISGCNDMTNEMKRMKELVEQLNEARKLYYQKDTSIMSDHQYDALYDELAALEEQTGVIFTNSHPAGGL